MAQLAPANPDDDGDATRLGDAVVALLVGTSTLSPSELSRVADVAGLVLGADSARVLVADYGLTSLQEFGEDGPEGSWQPIEGTFAGRAFARGEVVMSGDGPTVVYVPLTEGTERLGVLEITHAAWSGEVEAMLDSVVRILVLLLISKRRYSDVVLRARRSRPLSLAAEMQWDLLPPLTCSSDRVSLSGILEPAYSIGGDSFDYAFNPNHVEFAIVDAVGHGMSAVMISVTAINGLRNARREGVDLETAYLTTGQVIEEQFGAAAFATAQFGSLDVRTGELRWVNAGHPLPLLVRDGNFTGELHCRPALPLGLGGTVEEIATEKLQAGDRVLFYTDGVIETRSIDDDPFGIPRLADFLVRASLEELSPVETLRRLSASIMAYNGDDLSDDATLLLIEYHGAAEHP